GFGCTQTSDASYVFGVGVSTVNKSDIKIFPNPVTSIVHIESPVKVNVAISALDGKKILQGNNVTQVDLSGLSNGVYMITVYDENNNVIKIDKLVKTSW
ncbi:MAG: T9SS type A sorting domain-containing protein, partial [Flavipsychrobacter sp.]|nr:T9SS type A sorting domain-containing protein [Flavipsychrobacter sp.]